MMNRTFLLQLLFLIVMTVTGCKDFIQQPLVGHYELGSQERTETVLGYWSAEGDLGTIELDISSDARTEDFGLSVIENGEKYYGEATGAYYKDKIIFSVNLRTQGFEDSEGFKNICDFSKQGYALVGAYFVDESLYMIPADMEAFKNQMPEYFSVSGKLLGSGNCGAETVGIICDVLFSNSRILAIDETKEFMESVLNKFNEIFPQEDAVVFNKFMSRTD